MKTQCVVEQIAFELRQAETGMRVSWDAQEDRLVAHASYRWLLAEQCARRLSRGLQSPEGNRPISPGDYPLGNGAKGRIQGKGCASTTEAIQWCRRNDTMELVLPQGGSIVHTGQDMAAENGTGARSPAVLSASNQGRLIWQPTWPSR